MSATDLREAVAWCRDVATLLRCMEESEANGEKLTRKEKRTQREFKKMLRDMTLTIRKAMRSEPHDEELPN